MGILEGYFRDNGKDNGNYYIIGLYYRDYYRGYRTLNPNKPKTRRSGYSSKAVLRQQLRTAVETTGKRP